jgi:hypothetical protein
MVRPVGESKGPAADSFLLILVPAQFSVAQESIRQRIEWLDVWVAAAEDSSCSE